MPAFTITAVQPNPRDWTATVGGAMKGYRINVKDAAGEETTNVEWSRKATSPAPTVGETIDGDLQLGGPYGPKFKASTNGGFGGGGGGGRGRSPEERKSIQMQASQKVAVEALKLAAEFGEGEDKYRPPSAADVVAQIKLIASGLFQQIEEVSK